MLIPEIANTLLTLSLIPASLFPAPNNFGINMYPISARAGGIRENSFCPETEAGIQGDERNIRPERRGRVELEGREEDRRYCKTGRRTLITNG